MTEVTFADGLERIDEGAFEACGSLLSVRIPDTVTRIGASAFKDCVAFGTKDVTVGRAVSEIGSFAFSGCRALRSLTLPDGIRSLPGGICNDCEALRTATFSTDVVRVEANAFANCRSLTFTNGGTLRCVSLESAREICARAFFGCELLTNVTFSPDLESIGASAFEGCESLACLVLPASLKVLSQRAFFRCLALTFTGGDGLAQIGESAFASCKALQRVSVPGTVWVISPHSFEDCVSLSQLRIGDGVVEVGDFAFRGCEALPSVVLPPSVRGIGQGAFAFCSALERAELPLVEHLRPLLFDACGALRELALGGARSWIDEREPRERGIPFIGARRLRRLELLATSLDTFDEAKLGPSLADDATVVCAALAGTSFAGHSLTG